MNEKQSALRYFPHSIQISAQQWRFHDLGALSRLIAERGIPPIIFCRQLALKLNRQRPKDAPPVHAGQLNLYATLQTVYRYVIDVSAEAQSPGMLEDALRRSGIRPDAEVLSGTMTSFVDLF